MSASQSAERDALREALAHELRPLIGAHADIAANDLAASGRFALVERAKVERDHIGIAIERVIAEADTDLNDDELIVLRDNLLALFHGESTGEGGAS